MVKFPKKAANKNRRKKNASSSGNSLDVFGIQISKQIFYNAMREEEEAWLTVLSAKENTY